MTDAALSACEAWTGDRPLGCPHRSLDDPFVGRVLAAHPYFKNGNLATVHPRLSQRLARGLVHFDVALEAAKAARLKADHALAGLGGP